MNYRKKNQFINTKQKLNDLGIKFHVANEQNYHIKCGVVNFYAGTGKITIDNGRYEGGKGLDNFIKLVIEKPKLRDKKISKFTPSGKIRLLVRK